MRRCFTKGISRLTKSIFRLTKAISRLIKSISTLTKAISTLIKASYTLTRAMSELTSGSVGKTPSDENLPCYIMLRCRYLDGINPISDWSDIITLSTIP